MAGSALSIGSLCTGYGGLDLAAESVTGGRTVWVSDTDPDCHRILASRFPDATLHGSLIGLDPEPVDVITAGFPCQPVSHAGQRKGVDDERWIWDDIIGLVGRMDPQPRLLLFENVPGLLSANGGDAMASVVHGLAGLGYMGSYRLVRASDVGACHQRRRWFCVAWSAAHPPSLGGDDQAGELGPWSAGTSVVPLGNHSEYLPTPTAWLGRRPSSSDLSAHARRAGTNGKRSRELTGALLRNQTPWIRPLDEPQNFENALARFDVFTEAVTRHANIVGRPSPAPVTDNRLNPGFVEWMMMLPEGWVTDPAIGLSRSAQLRILGNGVVPAQAVLAYQSIFDNERKGWG